MPDQLQVYNRALGLLGCRKIASLVEDRESTRALDSVWTTVRDFAIEQANWVFAIRTAAAVPTTLPATLNYGYSYAFTRPVDCLHTYMLSTNVTFMPPLQDVLEADLLYFSRASTLYLRYVSNDANYGILLSRWPTSFVEYVSHYLAATICYRLTRNVDLASALYAQSDALLGDARRKDAINATVGTPQYNVRSRREFSLGDNPAESYPFVESLAPVEK